MLCSWVYISEHTNFVSDSDEGPVITSVIPESGSLRVLVRTKKVKLFYLFPLSSSARLQIDVYQLQKRRYSDKENSPFCSSRCKFQEDSKNQAVTRAYVQKVEILRRKTSSFSVVISLTN